MSGRAEYLGSVREQTEAYKKAIKGLTDGFLAGRYAIEDYKKDLTELKDNLKTIKDAIGSVPSVTKSAVTSIQGFSTAFTAFQTAFQAAADLAYGNINQLVSLYNAQIGVISAQNTYTQGLALQAEATVIYGKNSEQATRATTAANYVGALYTQSKMNEVVAQEQYYTATAQNLATIATSFVAAAEALGLLQTATTGFTIASILSAQELTLASIVPFAGLALVGGLSAYELLSQKAPTLSAPNMGSKATGTSEAGVSRTGNYFLHQGEIVTPAGGAGSSMIAPPHVEIHIHATSNVDLPRVRQEVQTAIAQSTLHAQKQRGVYG
jgi:hypothetical protein